MNSAREIAPNLEAVRPLVRQVREAGADLIALPENVAMLEPSGRLIREKAEPEDNHPALAVFQDLARETGAWILVGSLAVRLESGAVANRSLLIDAVGAVVARYDKIHMFDVDLEGGESYRESEMFRPGAQAVVARTPWGGLGMSICYDLRFPHLYRALAQAGAFMLAVPSAFTQVTGRAHWHALLRARAIENGCFVIAPAQCGTHAEGRKTYGHSLVVDPWGHVLADGGDGVGGLVAEVDPGRAAEVRRMIPSLTHDRDFSPAAGTPSDLAADGG
jgi:predicted amidohydrolase